MGLVQNMSMVRKMDDKLKRAILKSFLAGLKLARENGFGFTMINEQVIVLTDHLAERASNKLQKAASRIVSFLAMIEAHAELTDNPITDDAVVGSFVGSGASDILTIGDFRKLREALTECAKRA